MGTSPALSIMGLFIISTPEQPSTCNHQIKCMIHKLMKICVSKYVALHNTAYRRLFSFPAVFLCFKADYVFRNNLTLLINRVNFASYGYF